MSKYIRWTAKKRQKFLDALAETGNVTLSVKAVGASRERAYQLRKSDPEFAAAWDSAEQVALDTLEAEARRRAFAGVSEPVFYQGDVCGHVQKYSDTLMIFLLKGGRPEKYRDNVNVNARVEDVTPANINGERAMIKAVAAEILARAIRSGDADTKAEAGAGSADQGQEAGDHE